MVESGGGSKDNITMVEDGIQARGQDGVSTEKETMYTHIPVERLHYIHLEERMGMEANMDLMEMMSELQVFCFLCN